VIPSTVVHTILAERAEKSPTLRDLADLPALPPSGWRLEQSMCDELLGCREGDPFTSFEADRIQSLFFRRSGPIAAAIAITIEAPRGA